MQETISPILANRLRVKRIVGRTWALRRRRAHKLSRCRRQRPWTTPRIYEHTRNHRNGSAGRQLCSSALFGHYGRGTQSHLRHHGATRGNPATRLRASVRREHRTRHHAQAAHSATNAEIRFGVHQWFREIRGALAERLKSGTMSSELDQHDRQTSNGCLHFSCSAVEELREGFRQLELRAKEQGDNVAAVVAGSHHRLADKLVVCLGGLSVRQPNDQRVAPPGSGQPDTQKGN